jgi:glycosyltransferase involved in cell wall biosynthesis
MLDSLFTDIYANQGTIMRTLASLPRQLRRGGLSRLLNRDANVIPERLVNSFPLLGFEYIRRMGSARNQEEAIKIALWMGKRFGDRVVQNAGDDWTAAYVFNSAGLPILEACCARGVPGYLEQCSTPRLRELRLVSAESERLPEWGGTPKLSGADQDYAELEKMEWAAASHILCASEFVREGLIEEGADPKKISLVPYGVDVALACNGLGSATKIEHIHNRRKPPLRVLVAGKVCLQKGSHYVYEAAQILEGKAEFRMVGSISGLPEAILSSLRKRIDVLGPVPRSTMNVHYDWADVFLLPSLCEGSATVTYEALAHGVPVICTPNTGSVVRDGVDGFIVPSGTSIAIAQRLDQLANDEQSRLTMSANARSRAKEFTLAAYGTRLLSALASAKPSQEPYQL